MRRKPLLMAVGLCLAVLVVALAVLAAMLRYQPEFYRRAAVAPGELRKLHSREFRSQFYALINAIPQYKNWQAQFTDTQVNSYFEEDFLRSGNFERTFFPDGVNAPRIAIDNDHIRLGMRYGTGLWSTIVSVDLHVWLAANEPNVVVVEIERIRAGALPISAQSILDRLSETARRQDIEVTWYRRAGKPVALLRFGAGRQDTGVQLLQLRLQSGTLVIVGADRSKPGGGEVTATGTAPTAQ
jgi:hypothetical protein